MKTEYILEELRKKLNRIAIVLLCAAVLCTSFNGAMITNFFRSSIAYADNANYKRVADPNTMENYLSEDSLGLAESSRRAGRIWTDKTVFAMGQKEGEVFSGSTLKLLKNEDGSTSEITLNTDFLHVFSALGSGQNIQQFPPSPIDLVIVLDVSSSMGDSVDKSQTDYKDTPDIFETTRFLEMVDATDKTITALMEQNSKNRVSVVVYDRRATVVMPLAHYEPNTLPISEIKSSHDKVDANGSLNSNFVYDTKYLNDGNTDESTDDLKKLHSQLKDRVYHYIAPYFDGHGSNGSSHPENYVNVSTFRVVATTTDKDSSGKPIETSNFERIAGTNTHSGVAAGLQQLADAEDTTFKANLSIIGEDRTVARIPAAIVMTDGGSNTVADGQWYNPDWDQAVQRSDHMNDWSSVVVLQSLMTAAYMKSAVEKNYSLFMDTFKTGFQIYTVGVDVGGRLDDDWAVARIYPMLDPETYFKKDLKPDDLTISETLSSSADNIKNKSVELIKKAYENWEKWANGNDAVTQEFLVVEQSSNQYKARFQQSESDPQNSYVIPFEHESVNQATAKDNGWHGGQTTKVDNFDKEIKGTAVFNQLPTSNYEGLGKYAQAKTVGDRKVDAVTKDDIISNINYVTEYFDVSAVDMDDIFTQVLNRVTSNVTVPIGGSNDAGVEDSLTYMDPIGEYMEIKDNGVTIDGTTYDMGLLLFETMHGLVKTGIYDYSFNSTHLTSEGKFTEGWYDEDGNILQDQTKGSWANGDIYHLGIDNARKYISTLNEKEDDFTEQEKNTVYTIYRFAEDTDKRNEDHKNPCYQDASNITYKLSDIRVWVEDTGDFEDEQGGSALDLGYSQALYVNIPTSALPVQTVSISVYEDKIGYALDTYYKQNMKEKLNSDHVTPFRLFYGVGVESDIMSADGIDIDIAKVDSEYVASHTEENGDVYFLSNYYSNTPYQYTTDETTRTRGDANTTFSPASDNHYYLFQSPLVLYKITDPNFDKNGKELTVEEYQQFLKDNKDNVVTNHEEANSDNWYYIIVEYYTNNEDGTGTLTRRLVPRQGAEFGSKAGGEIGEYLVWYNLDKKDYSYEESTKDFNGGVKPTEEGNWVLATKPGGLRTGNMAESRVQKSENRTDTAYNVDIPIVSENTDSSNVVMDKYLGNNGKIVIQNRLLEVTKEVEAIGGESDPDESFDFEIYIDGYVGDHSAIALIKNPYSHEWQLRIESIDVVTNNQGLLQGSAGTLYRRNGNYIYLGGDYSQEESVYHLYSASDSDTSVDLENVGITTYVDAESIKELENTKSRIYKVADKNHPLGSIEFWTKAYLIPKSEVDNNEWTFDESKASQYQTEENFVISTLTPSNITTEAQIQSPYLTKTVYLTKTLIFGYNEGNKPDTKPENWPGTDEDWEWANQSENANKARFSLKDGEGLAIVGLDDKTDYRVTEMISDTQKEKGYELNRVVDEKETQREIKEEGNQYTVSGKINSVTENHFVNRYRARYDLELTKEVRGQDGDSNLGWNFMILLTPIDGEEIPTEYTYTKGEETGKITFIKGEDGIYRSSTITLKHGETIKIHNLLSNTKYEIQETTDYESLGYTSSVATGTDYDEEKGTLDENKKVKFINTNLAEQDLTIKKTVEGGAGEKEKEWHFDITLTPREDVTLADSYPYNGSKSGNLKFTKQEDGTYTGSITLKHGESVTIEGLPEGTKYKVSEEEANQDKYRTTTSDNTEGTLNNKVEVTVSFVNTKNLYYPLTIEKIVKGGAGDTEKEWTFEIHFRFDENAEILESYPYTGKSTVTGVEAPKNGNLIITKQGDGSYLGSITLKHGQSITIDKLPENTAYEITEKEADQDGYSTSIPTNSVGTLTEEQTITFTNTKLAKQDLTIEKEVVDGDTEKEWHFDITLIPANNISLENQYSYTSTRNTEEKTGTIEFRTNEDGSYTGSITLKHGESITIHGLPERTRYTISESEANQGGYETKVSNNYEGILPEKDGSATIKVHYTNRKLSANTLTIAKEVLGSKGEKEREWNFQIEFTFASDVEVKESYPYTGNSTIEGVDAPNNGSLTITQQEDGTYLGNITLKHGQSITIKYLPVGTKFKVSEKEANQEDYQTVSKGDIEGTTDGTKVFYTMFSNSKGVSYDLTLKKIVQGHSGELDKEWEFVITLTPAEYETIQKEYSYTGTKEGKISFEEKNGSYVGKVNLKHNDEITIHGIPENTTYSIKETEANLNGYHTVIEGKDSGTLTENGTKVEFTNTKLSLVNLIVKKLVKGNLGNKEKEWHFQIFFTKPEFANLNETYTAYKEGNGNQEELTLSLTEDHGRYVTDFTLKDGETLTIPGLPEGTEYEVKEVEAGVDGYTTTYTENVKGTLEQAPVEVTVTNWNFDSLKLILEKKLEGNDIEKNKEWTFKITFTSKDGYPFPSPYPYIGTGKEDGSIDFEKQEDGSYQGIVGLRGGQKITLEGIPYGTEYSIEEVEANKNRYQTTVKNGKGTLVEEETLVTFINKRELKNPNTADGISQYIVFFLISLTTIMGMIIYYFRKKVLE